MDTLYGFRCVTNSFWRARNFKVLHEAKKGIYSTTVVYDYEDEMLVAGLLFRVLGLGVRRFELVKLVNGNGVPFESLDELKQTALALGQTFVRHFPQQPSEMPHPIMFYERPSSNYERAQEQEFQAQARLAHPLATAALEIFASIDEPVQTFSPFADFINSMESLND
jgi:hypothetical protein